MVDVKKSKEQLTLSLLLWDPILKNVEWYSKPVAEERCYFFLCMGISFYLHKLDSY